MVSIGPPISSCVSQYQNVFVRDKGVVLVEGLIPIDQRGFQLGRSLFPKSTTVRTRS